MKAAQFAAGLSVEQLSAAIDAYELSRDERLQLARIQARLGLRAIKDGETGAARAFLADALGYLEQAGGAGR